MNKLNKRINNKGFTFIETILYVAIVSLILVSLTNFALTIIQLNAKNAVQQDVNTAARYISERIKYEIRNANDINTGTSNFGINLATNNSYQLSLLQAAPNNPTIFNVQNGIAQIKLGASSAVGLNDSKVKVTNLTFTNNTSSDMKSKNISFTLSIQYVTTSNSKVYLNTADIVSSAELRSN